MRRALLASCVVFAVLLAGVITVFAGPGGQGTPPPGTPYIAVCSGAGDCSYWIEYHAPATIPVTYVSPTPTPSATPSSTPVTPIVIPTNTPSNTPEPPTPTPETGTPIPTEPPAKPCELQAMYNITVRAGPSTSHEALTTWTAHSVAAFTEFAADARYLWGRHGAGWSVVRERPDWWAWGTLGSDVCQDKDDWPAGVIPPEPIARGPAWFGWHNVIGESDRAGMIASLVIAQGKGWATGTKNVETPEAALATLQAGGMAIVRWQPDCPDTSLSPEAAARQMFDRVRWVLAALPVDVLVEVDNECNIHYRTTASMEWADAFYTAAIPLYGQYGHRVIVGSFFMGWFNAEWAAALDRTWATIAAHDAIWGIHNYGWITGSYPNNYVPLRLSSGHYPHLSYGHRYARQHIASTGAPVPDMLITEAGTGTGWEAYNRDDHLAYMRQVACDPGLLGVAWWTMGLHEAEYSADGLAIETARQLPAAPVCAG